MGNAYKTRIAGTASIVCAVIMVACIGKMLPYGLSGNIGKAKLWIILMFVAFIISLPFGVAYYYYRNRSGTEDQKVGVEALASYGDYIQKNKKKR